MKKKEDCSQIEIIKEALDFYKKQGRTFCNIPSNSIELFSIEYNSINFDIYEFNNNLKLFGLEYIEEKSNKLVFPRSSYFEINSRGHIVFISNYDSNEFDNIVKNYKKYNIKIGL